LSCFPTFQSLPSLYPVSTVSIWYCDPSIEITLIRACSEVRFVATVDVEVELVADTELAAKELDCVETLEEAMLELELATELDTTTTDEKAWLDEDTWEEDDLDELLIFSEDLDVVVD
jgi:hypothetical protein